MNKIIFIIILIMLFYFIFKKNNEGFTPEIRQIYRPYMRTMRIHIEPFYNKYYRIKEYMNKIYL